MLNPGTNSRQPANFCAIRAGPLRSACPSCMICRSCIEDQTARSYIDLGTGGKITGMIAAADKILALAGNYTKIVPGHGPLGNKADLTKFRDMLIAARDRVQKLKSAGKSAQEAVAEKPFADLDAVWGKGIISTDQFVQIVYLTL